MSFEQFKIDFDKHYNNNIYRFMEDQEEGLIFMSMSLEINQDNIYHDSYGQEDSDLKRIFKCPEHNNIFVMFTGNRSSYQGEEWYSYNEVKPKEKTILVWE